MKKKAGKTQNKEEIAEDWCFTCKDGGLLRVCDYKQCLKAYHPDCVEKDDSFLDSGNRWTCDLHSCCLCHKSPKYECYCCPTAVCERCFKTAEFVHVRGKKGFCNHCLKLALLVEENKNVDSDGERVDFKDRETYEGLFREYWEIINETEHLTLENLVSANARLKIGKNYNSDPDSDEFHNSEENQVISDYDDMDDVEAHKPDRKRKRCKGKNTTEKLSWMKGKVKSNKKEFIGWGSKSLIQFLKAIGKSTTEKLSQHEVTNIINGYIKENNLFDSKKKRKVVCDARLRAVFGRKTVNKHRISDLLEVHFTENQEQSEEDEMGYNSEDEDDGIMAVCKGSRKSKSDGISRKREAVMNIIRFNFASIVPENIKCIYLKRSLVQQLLQQPNTFESKIIGSFVRVKTDPNVCGQKNSYQLVQVTGIKKCLVGENDGGVLLQVSDMPKDVCINVLSDDDFSEEECQDLRKKVKDGLLKKLTMDWLEQKARSLHEDIINHRIPRELSFLQNRIDQANEKGWRRELFEYLDRRQKLLNPTEQARMLQEVPKVIPDEEEVEPVYEDLENDKEGNEGSPTSILMGTSEIQVDNCQGNRTSSDVAASNEKSSTESIVFGSAKDGGGNTKVIYADTAANATKEKMEHEERILMSETPTKEEKRPKRSHVVAPEDEENCLNASITEVLPTKYGCLSSTKKTHMTDVEQKSAKSQLLIDLNSSDGSDVESGNAVGKQKLEEDPESCIWHRVGPDGERDGPYSLALLKSWSEKTPRALKFKVWKTSQSEEQAIPLSDAVSLAFP